jgi:hypothetical protein
MTLPLPKVCELIRKLHAVLGSPSDKEALIARKKLSRLLAKHAAPISPPDLATLTLLLDDMVFPNGLAFSPDESALYINDFRRGHIRAFDMTQNGTLAKQTDRVFVDLTGPEPGGPDAMKVDSAGNVYCGGSRLRWHRLEDALFHQGALPRLGKPQDRRNPGAGAEKGVGEFPLSGTGCSWHRRRRGPAPGRGAPLNASGSVVGLVDGSGSDRACEHWRDDYRIDGIDELALYHLSRHGLGGRRAAGDGAGRPHARLITVANSEGNLKEAAVIKTSHVTKNPQRECITLDRTPAHASESAKVKLIRFRHFCSGSFALASLNRTCRNPVPTLPQRSPPRLWTQQLAVA